MEPDAGAKISADLEKKGCKVKTLIMDDDSTTINRIENTVKHKVIKLSDYNHTKRNLTAKLWKLNGSYKKEMTPAAIGHIKKCYSYALNQNKGNTAAVSAHLKSIVPHLFGQHDLCKVTWCGFRKNEKSYHPTILLTDQNLRHDLEKIMETLVKNVDKIAPCASTKSNESFNNMVAQKAPKSRHYSSSLALKTRVKCAMLQKNMSYKYVSQIKSKCGLSPGTFTEKHCRILTNKRKRVSVIKRSPAFKKRRLEKQGQLVKSEATKELREGVTYEKGCALTSEETSTEETISPPLTVPQLKCIESANQDIAMVFFDTETTSLAMDCDIVQLSAKHNDSSFNKYIIPSKPVCKKASEVTGITINNGIMCCRGRPVDNQTAPLIAATDFVSWLHQIPKPVVLYGHNCKVFDSPRLLRLLRSCNIIAAFTEKVLGFVDTLPLFKDLYPELKSHRQEILVSKCLGVTYNAHNSMDDVQSLSELVEKSSPSLSEHTKFSFTTTSAVERLISTTASEKRKQTLDMLVSNKILSKAMARKVADSGLDLRQLKTAHMRDEERGIKLVFTETHEGKCRVTSNSRIIKAVRDFLHNM